jgi:hypothetical protein
MSKEFKKLTPKQKVRVEGYMNMLELHPNYWIYDSERIEILDRVERVLYKGYRNDDKVTLNKMEKLYHSLVLRKKYVNK